MEIHFLKEATCAGLCETRPGLVIVHVYVGDSSMCARSEKEATCAGQCKTRLSLLIIHVYAGYSFRVPIVRLSHEELDTSVCDFSFTYTEHCCSASHNVLFSCKSNRVSRLRLWFRIVVLRVCCCWFADQPVKV